ncbi:MAG: 5-(carboxyamino)imidazole ribonucleotide synthase [Bacteroidetes bacterium]|nr:5-(carboxyamino)imidazole ribonucleotide synthase [Bacteroidota bacterium]
MKPQRIGMLGGGQLGRMLIQKGIDWNLRFKVLDPDASAPCAGISDFTHGKLTDYDTVLKFGEDCDLITIEIENVNTAALHELERRGKRVYPQPRCIEVIQDKRTQKQFYLDNGLPTSEFLLTNNRQDVMAHQGYFLPAVHKLGREGYDGRGVQVLRSESDLPKAFDAPGVLEKFVDFKAEISVIVARSSSREVKSFPAVEMVFHPEANLVEYLFAPAEISSSVEREAEHLAQVVIEKLDLVGILAVEMFVTKDDRVLINEMAPRPHNSGHQSIEANITSQYEQHLRAILNLPLGATTMRCPGAMVNLLGEPGYEGPARYEGLEDVLATEGVFVHLYGKVQTRPFRKMGHVTIIDQDVESLKKKANFVRNTLKVKA